MAYGGQLVAKYGSLSIPANIAAINTTADNSKIYMHIATICIIIIIVYT